MSNFKYKELNILKGIAFLFVFIVHFNQAFVMDVGVIQKILMYGQSGCQLFLLISGFLVANSFEKRDFNFKTYLKKKYINIAPGYILAVLFYVFLTLIAEGCQLNVPFKITNIYIYIYIYILAIILNIFLLNGLVPFCNNNIVPGGWYVGTLMVIYFILPFILKLLKKNKKVLRLLVVVSCLLSLVATTIIYIVNSEFTGNNSFTFYSFITQLPAVLIGVAVYYNREKLLSAKIALGILLFIAATGITFLLFFIGNEILTSLVPFFAAISFVGLYIVVCRIKDNKLFSLLAKIGDISFSAYLIHFVFAWYLPAIIKNIVNVSDNILFIILLLPCFCLSICFAGAINILLNKISGKLKKILL